MAIGDALPYAVLLVILIETQDFSSCTTNFGYYLRRIF